MVIFQYARMFGEYHAVAGPVNRREVLGQIPLPTTIRFLPENPPSPDCDKDRAHLSPADAIRYKRISGLAPAVEVEPPATGACSGCSANCNQCFLLEVRGPTLGTRIFLITAYSAAFTDPRADGASAHVDMGMASVGIAEALLASKISTNLISRYRDVWRMAQLFPVFANGAGAARGPPWPGHGRFPPATRRSALCYGGSLS